MMKKAVFIFLLLCCFSGCFSQLNKTHPGPKKWKHALAGRVGLDLKLKNTKDISWASSIQNDRLLFSPNIYLGYIAERKLNRQFSYNGSFNMNLLQINRNSRIDYNGWVDSELPVFKGNLRQRNSFFSVGIQQGFSVLISEKFEYSFNLGLNFSCYRSSFSFGKNELDGTEFRTLNSVTFWPQLLVTANNSITYKISKHYKAGIGAEIYPGAGINLFYSFLDFRYTF